MQVVARVTTNGKPPRVDDVETFWTEPPPERSPRCAWWVARVNDGFRPNRHARRLGYYAAAEHYGVYLWEYLHVLLPLLLSLQGKEHEK